MKGLHVRDKIKWGVLGCGRIAEKFVTDLKKVPGSVLWAVGSREKARADDFADKHAAMRAYKSYEELARDSDLDIVYVATPHSLHCENSILCLSNRKAVLCEKPMAVNTKEVVSMVNCARKRKIFLMEAMWTRFMPVIVKVRQWLKEEKIGDVRMVYADFGFQAEKADPHSRLFNKNLAGGALLDVGVYPVALAYMVLGSKPIAISAQSFLGKTGVDEQTAMILKYKNGAIAQLSCSIQVMTPDEATICGTKGTIKIHPPFWRGLSATLEINGKEPVTIEGDSGYHFEAIESMRCLGKKLLESNIMTHQDSIDIAETMDNARKIIGLRYPKEKR